MGVRWSRMSWSEKNDVWERWRRGESLGELARALHRGSPAPTLRHTARAEWPSSLWTSPMRG